MSVIVSESRALESGFVMCFICTDFALQCVTMQSFPLEIKGE